MASYPGGVYAPRTKANRNGVVYDATKETVLFVEDLDNSDDEIIAIETELGANPKGDFADVHARLDNVDTVFGPDPEGAAADVTHRFEALEAITPFSPSLELLQWNSIDGYATSLSSSCTITPGGSMITFSLANVSTRYARLSSVANFNYLFETAKAVTIEFILSDYPAGSVETTYLYFQSPVNWPALDNDEHIGFLIVTGRIWSHSSNGANHEHTDSTIDTSNGVQRTRLKIIFIKGTSAKFYINDVLFATHTTYIPTLSSPALCMYTLNGANGYWTGKFGKITISKVI